MVNMNRSLKSTYVICYENIAYKTAIKIYRMASKSTCGCYKIAIKFYEGVITVYISGGTIDAHNVGSTDLPFKSTDVSLKSTRA